MQPRKTLIKETRRRLAARVASRAPTPVPLCLDPLTARLAEQIGYEAGYVSGGALGFSLAVSEALLSIDELADLTRAIAARCDLPIVVDGGVGFGDPVHVTRMMWELEAAGAAAVEIEDQVAPKRVSHHRGVEHLVSRDEMVSKVAAAVAARQDPNFLVIVRTGAVRHEGINAACDRARAYVDAGADVLLVPIPATNNEIATVGTAVDVPLATFATFDHALDDLAPGIGLYFDPLTPHVATYRATKDLLERHHRGEPTGIDAAEVMTLYRELGTTGGFEGLYDIERATTEVGT
jgi:2-methylisocitrate lyase-like PEP mutase family enzyme